MGTSDLGWPATRKKGAFRVGPHITGNGNGREIEFRNHKIADLMAAAMWLIHTGNGGRLADYPVVYWHGARPLGVNFGSKRSDHHAKVAFDVNWPWHPWEVSCGTKFYDNHMAAGGALARQHELFAAVEDRLDSMVRWCGRTWRTDGTDLYGGFNAYPRGHRDCMHFVIGSRSQAKIDRAHANLITWFKPPRTVKDIKALQRRLGINADGIWGQGSVSAMRAEQRRLRVPQTGLPGDVATRLAWAAERADERTERVEATQTALQELGYYTGRVDGSFGPATERAAREAAADTNYKGDVRDSAFARHLEDTVTVLTAKIDEVGKKVDALAAKLAQPTPVAEGFDDGPPVPGRLSGANRYETAAMVARQAQPSRVPGKVYLAASGSDDAVAAAGAGDGLVVLAKAGSATLPKATADVLRELEVTEIVVVGGPRSIPNAQAHRAVALALGA